MVILNLAIYRHIGRESTPLEPEDLATLAGLLTSWKQEKGNDDPEISSGEIRLHAVISDIEEEYAERSANEAST